MNVPVLQADIHKGGYQESDVVQDIALEVYPGELVGLLGPNGAGKSTTIKSLLGILPKFEGSIEIKDYAYIPERPIYYEGWTLYEHFTFLFSTLEESFPEEKVGALLHEFGLYDMRHHYPERFSKGMQQKGMILLSLLRRPDVYIIDEPFMGLDPKAVKRFLTMVKEEQKRGAGVLMSTHVLDTAEKICDRFILMAEGKIIASGTMEEIRRASGLPEASLFDCFDALT
ncbi:ABC transporter ATP-binding protein [Salimicrobium flavidum]|uniref:ABC-2 type transport system ATP-binding protein n=1 Tax=Salimicrobium flavidum TaxID=570947 RepID=A0A1N7INJ7_9BACI|nr:ABC transporter ATP-binding protein [Salimicrobium flavidum]SIS38649.1 ABC-2 type transport system ATP-binding protein [Salimicrobium flavidum]